MAAMTTQMMWFRKKEKKTQKVKEPIDLSKRLYLRMPYKIKEVFEIQELHPLITRVILPRQSGRYCFLEFGSAADAELALEELSGKELASGRHLVVTKPGVKSRDEAEDAPLKFRIQRTPRKNINTFKLNIQ